MVFKNGGGVRFEAGLEARRPKKASEPLTPSLGRTLCRKKAVGEVVRR